VPSLGQLDEHTLRGVEELAAQMAARMSRVYQTSVLGFEYGLNLPDARRIEHAHLHLLPTEADLRDWLSSRLAGYDITSLTELPATRRRSYITVWQPRGSGTVYSVPNDASPRIRLREVVAALDGRVTANTWDWQTFPCANLIQQTVDDLSHPANRPDTALSVPGRPR